MQADCGTIEVDNHGIENRRKEKRERGGRLIVKTKRKEEKGNKEKKDKTRSKDYLNQSNVVATTCRNSTCSMLTSAKLSVGYLVVGITKELDKEPLLHCYPIYISYRWSMLQQCVYLMSTPQWLCKTVHPTLTSMCPTCGSNVVYMLPDIIV